MRGLSTSRLDLVPATAAHLEAELESNARLASLLDARVPDGWPPGEYDRPAVEHFRDRLAANPEAVGWYGWYALLRPQPDEKRTLVAAGGFLGPPDDEGAVEIGYSVVPAFEGRGFATELVAALVDHAFLDSRVTRVIAHTTSENVRSVKVLERTGFTFTGFSPDSVTLEYARARREGAA